MPTPLLTDAQCLEAIEAVQRNDGNKAHAAKSLNMDRGTFNHRIRTAKKRGLHLSDGVRNALGNARISPQEGDGGWIHNYDEEGKKTGTTRWSKKEADTTDLLEAMAEAFADIPAATHVASPSNVMADLCTLYPLMDVHLGMRAWSRETGGDNYDLQAARDDMHYAFSKLDALTPPSQKAILLIGGDAFHADDERAETPQSKHKLDVDGRHWKVLDEGVNLIAAVIDRLSEKHAKIVVRVLRGNHDPHSHMVLTFALAQRYRQCKRITIEKEPRDIFMSQWGRCLISAHHGDKAKPDRLSMYLSDICPFWSETRHRHMFVGHVHHDNAKDIGPLRWESLRAFCPPDSYAASMGYGGRRAIQSITFHKTDGIVLRALDPIERST